METIETALRKASPVNSVSVFEDGELVYIKRIDAHGQLYLLPFQPEQARTIAVGLERAAQRCAK